MPTNPDSLNPHHPVTRALNDQWHKLFAIHMAKLGVREVVLTAADIEKALATMDGLNIAARELPDGLHITLVSDNEARRLARIHGGVSGN